MKKTVRVMLVGDDGFVRGGIVPLLKECASIEIVAEAIDGIEAIEQAMNKKPDIAVVDFSTSRLCGLGAVNCIHSVLPQCRLLVVATDHNDDNIVPIVEAGASGYLIKKKVATELNDAIETLSSGQVYFGQTATRVLAEQLARDCAQEELN